jgi:beta-glucosidase
VISTLKHYAINPQETGRAFMNAAIAEDALRESDLLAFEIAIEQGDPGSVMCAYNATNGPQSCGSAFLLTEVLRNDWGFKGFTMSDWGAVDALDYALAGLDQQSGSGIDPQPFFGAPLKQAAANDPAYRARLGEMVRRVLHAIYDNGLDKHPAVAGTVDAAANSAVALEVAREGIVLLSNREGILPLGAGVKRIAVIGGHADAGTLLGGGSSKVLGDQGPSVSVPSNRDGTAAFGAMLDQVDVPRRALRGAARQLRAAVAARAGDPRHAEAGVSLVERRNPEPRNPRDIAGSHARLGRRRRPARHCRSQVAERQRNPLVVGHLLFGRRRTRGRVVLRRGNRRQRPRKRYPQNRRSRPEPA